jgi:transcriptional regulator with XRE-family HTH domain
MVQFGEVETFGTLLTTRRSGKPRSQYVARCHVGISTLTAWEDGRSFPENGKLPEISAAYDATMAELEVALEISRNARKREIAGRKPAKVKLEDSRIAFHSGCYFSGAVMGTLNRYARR